MLCITINFVLYFSEIDLLTKINDLLVDFLHFAFDYQFLRILLGIQNRKEIFYS